MEHNSHVWNHQPMAWSPDPWCHGLMGINFHSQFRESQSATLQIALGDAPAVAVIGEPPLLKSAKEKPQGALEAVWSIYV